MYSTCQVQLYLIYIYEVLMCVIFNFFYVTSFFVTFWYIQFLLAYYYYLLYYWKWNKWHNINYYCAIFVMFYSVLLGLHLVCCLHDCIFRGWKSSAISKFSFIWTPKKLSSILHTFFEDFWFFRFSSKFYEFAWFILFSVFIPDILCTL